MLKGERKSRSDGLNESVGYFFEPLIRVFIKLPCLIAELIPPE
jgi:hypothetical protein